MRRKDGAEIDREVRSRKLRGRMEQELTGKMVWGILIGGKAQNEEKNPL